MSVLPNPQTLKPASSLGLDRDPLPGDPAVLQGIVDHFTLLRDTAWSVSLGLDAFLASASSGGFEAATADALRELVSGRLKTFILNVARSFSLVAEGVAEYRSALVAAQQSVSGAVSQAAGLKAGDPALAGLKKQVSDQRAAVADAAASMEAALRDAADMVSQPIGMPSVFDRIWNGFEKALMIVGIALTVIGVFSSRRWRRSLSPRMWRTSR